MSPCIATSRLVHNGGYIQKLSKLFNSLEILCLGIIYLATEVLLKLERFYGTLAVIQYFRLGKSVILDKFVTFCKRVYTIKQYRCSGHHMSAK